MMKRTAILASALALLAALPAAVSAATIDQIVGSPSNYDGRHVDVKGTVQHLEHKVSHHGNPYVTYAICSAQCVPVIAFDDLKTSDGQAITVHGIYESVKHVGEYTFHNGIVADGLGDDEIPCS